jgi:hypothetical protein
MLTPLLGLLMLLISGPVALAQVPVDLSPVIEVLSGAPPVPKVECETAEIDRRVGSASIRRQRLDFMKISEVSAEYAQLLFDELKALPDIPFDYPEDGCFARAHAMVKHLDQQGIHMAKVFLHGDLRVETHKSPKGYVEWRYHVAPMMMVRNGNKKSLYVFDPAIFDRPVTLEEWIQVQTSHPGGSKDKISYARRFTYDLWRPRQSYVESDTQDMQDFLERFMQVQNHRRSIHANQ